MLSQVHPDRISSVPRATLIQGWMCATGGLWVLSQDLLIGTPHVVERLPLGFTKIVQDTARHDYQGYLVDADVYPLLKLAPPAF